MWRCSNCTTEIEDRHFHCWQCGTKRGAQPTKTQGPVQQTAVPGFSSFEEMAETPAPGSWVFRRGLVQRGVFFLVIIALLKISSSQFLGTYGTYVVMGVAIVALIVILWRSFRRHPTEGVGIKLH